MRKFKLSAFLIAILCVFSISVSAETITDLGDCPIVSITLPDSAETATRELCSPKLLDRLKTTKPAIDQTMAAGNLYILSFGDDGKGLVQYTLSSTSNPGMPGGNINNLSSKQFESFTTNIKAFLESDNKTKIENTAPLKSGEYSYLCLDGFTSDEVNGSKLYFRTYATVQNDSLVLLRAMNYSTAEFDEEQKKALDSIAESIAYKKEATPAQNTPTATETAKTAPEATVAPEQTEVAKQTQAPVTTEATKSTTPPQTTTVAPTGTPATATEKVQSTETKKTDETQKTGNTFPVIGIISAVIILAAVVIFIVIKRKKK